MDVVDIYRDREDVRMEAELAALYQAVAGLMRTLAAAREAQWTAAHVPAPSEDTTERAQGGRSDPTHALVTDTKRLAVRAGVLHSVNVIKSSRSAIATARDRLDTALSNWEGR